MIAFVHINKTAGTNLKYILRRSFGGKHCDARVWPQQKREEREEGKRVLTAEDVRKTKWVYPGLKSLAGHNITSYSDLHTVPGLKFYTFLREPISRAISHYEFQKKFNPDIEPIDEWIRKAHYRNVQCMKICGEENAEKAIEVIRSQYGFVGLQQRYDESLLLLKKWINDPAFDPRHMSHNVAAKKKDGTSPLDDPATKALLEEANAEDTKLYQYVLNEVYPAQVKAYGKTLAADLAAFEKENHAFKKLKSNRGKIQRGLYWLFLPLISRGGTFK